MLKAACYHQYHLCQLMYYNNKLMMDKLSLKINIANLKDVKVGLSSFNYYLKMEFDSKQQFVTSCRNLIHQEGIFELQNDKVPQKVQVWNYDSLQKIGTIFIKKYCSLREFRHTFKKQNITIILCRSQKTQLSGQIEVQTDQVHTYRSNKSGSQSTDSQSEE